jgi:hypothetical protein
MSLLGTSIAQSVAGITQAERVSVRDADKKRTGKPDRVKRGTDEVEVETSQATDAVRNLKGNADEETEDDRQQKDHYRPQGVEPAEGIEARPHIDVEG